MAAVAGDASLVRVARSLRGPTGAAQHAIVVAAAETLVDEVHATLMSHGLSDVIVVAGGANRLGCMVAALNYLSGQSVSHVLVHDVRWPLASTDLANRVTAALRAGNSVALPALPLTDSVKTVDAQGSVTGTVDRSALRTVQYPRGFTVDQLGQLVKRCDAEDFDELSQAIAAGAAVTLVDGDPDAFAADLPRDAQFIEAVIACRR